MLPVLPTKYKKGVGGMENVHFCHPHMLPCKSILIHQNFGKMK